jgi:replicative DNA helicase
MPDDLHFGLSMRAPPANVQAEMGLLGALLANNKMLDRCGNLKPEDFAGDGLGAVFSAIKEGVNAGRLVDGVSLGNRFDRDLIVSLMGAMVAPQTAPEYARTIKEAAQHRELIDLCDQVRDGCYGGVSPRELGAKLSAAFDRVSAGELIDRATTLDAAMDSAIAAMEKAASGQTAGISTGFRSFDYRLGGLEPGLVYVIAGRPAMGKSSVGHQIAVNAARNGNGVLELSLEMSATQLGRRTLATAAQVPIGAMKSGGASHSTDFSSRIIRARKELAGLPLTIDDAAGQTPAQIAAKARSARRRHGLGLVMIDHLNLMRAEDQDARHGGTWSIERASGTVLQMAKECECPVILLAQLNRGVEGREDKRPNLADLRQAGAIEQDAYAVGFVFRPEYYLGSVPERKGSETEAHHEQQVEEWHEHKNRLSGKAEMIWQKIRDGEPGTDNLTFHGPTATFGEAE